MDKNLFSNKRIKSTEPILKLDRSLLGPKFNFQRAELKAEKRKNKVYSPRIFFSVAASRNVFRLPSAHFYAFTLEGLILQSQENYGTLVLKTECLSILFERLVLEDLYKGAFCFCPTGGYLMVLCGLRGLELAKEMICPKALLALIKATIAGCINCGLFSETQVRRLMSDTITQRFWLRK